MVELDQSLVKGQDSFGNPRRRGKMKKSLAEAIRRYRQRHKKLRLCVMCSNKAIADKNLCQACWKSAHLRYMSRPLLCIKCKKPIPPEERARGRRYHKLCRLERKGEIQRKYWRTGRYKETHRLAALAYQRRHKALGLCRTCSNKSYRWDLCRKHFRRAYDRYLTRSYQ